MGALRGFTWKYINNILHRLIAWLMANNGGGWRFGGKTLEKRIRQKRTKKNKAKPAER